MRTLPLALVAVVFVAFSACDEQSEIPTAPLDAVVATTTPEQATPLFSGGGAWDYQVSGGTSLTSLAGLQVTVTAKDQDGIKGQATYRYPPANRDWHGEVVCLKVEGNRAAIGVDFRPNGDSAPAGMWEIWLWDVEGGPDHVRVPPFDNCANAPGVTPGGVVVIDGNFNVRSK